MFKKCVMLAVVVSLIGIASTQAVFTPPQQSVLHSWINAGVGVTKDGSDLVSGVTDQSGNGKNATQATGGKQPVYVATGINGLPSLRFDGINDSMQIPSLGDVTHIGYSIFIAAKFQTNKEGAAIVQSWNTELPGYCGNRFSLVSSAGTYSAVQLADSGHYGSTTAGTMDTAVHIFSLTFDASAYGSGLPSPITLRVMSAGGVVAEGSADTQTAGLTPYGPINLAMYNWLGTEYDHANIDIAEVLIYRDNLNTTDRDAVEGYLAGKYNVPEPATMALLGIGAISMLRRRMA